MTDTLQLSGLSLPVPVWAAIIAGLGALSAAVIGGLALLIAQFIGRKNLRLQLDKDERHFQLQMEKDERRFQLQTERDERHFQFQMKQEEHHVRLQTEQAEKLSLLEWERDDRKRLQDARLKAYQTFFEKADLWSSIMAPGTPGSPATHEEVQRLINEMIAASAPARLVAPAETVQLMVGYLAVASQVVWLSKSDPHNSQAQDARYQAEEAHVRLTDAARKDVGNTSGSIARMYQSVR